MFVHLVPFAITIFIYFCSLPSLKPSFWALLLKCLPIYSLAGAVFFHKNNSLSGSERRIIHGLIFSSIGDACLVWKELFPLGMVAFATAHYFYIRAFGFKPLKPLIGLFLYIFAGFVLFHILPNIEDPIIFYGIPVYSLFLVTMSWRALARATAGKDAWSWPKTMCAIGSLLFIASDTTICFHDFQNPIPFGRILIMSTYYAAQLGIALCVKSNLDWNTSSSRKLK